QRAADYYGRPLRVVIDAHRAQVVMVEPVGGPPMLHGGPYASTGAPYWRRSYAYPYGVPDDAALAPPGSVMAPRGQPPQSGLPPAYPHAQPQVALPPATQVKPPAKSAAITPARPPVPRKRPADAPQTAAGSIEPLHTAPQASPEPAKPAAPPPASSEKPAN